MMRLFRVIATKKKDFATEFSLVLEEIDFYTKFKVILKRLKTLCQASILCGND